MSRVTDPTHDPLLDLLDRHSPHGEIALHEQESPPHPGYILAGEATMGGEDPEAEKTRPVCGTVNDGLTRV